MDIRVIIKMNQCKYLKKMIIITSKIFKKDDNNYIKNI